MNNDKYIQQMNAQKGLLKVLEELTSENVLIDNISLNRDKYGLERINIMIPLEDHKRLYNSEPFKYDCCTTMYIHLFEEYIAIVSRSFVSCKSHEIIAMKWMQEQKEE